MVTFYLKLSADENCWSYGHSVCIFLLLILPKVRWRVDNFWVNFRRNCLIFTVFFKRWRIIWLDYQIRFWHKYEINAPERNSSFIADWISFKTGFFAGKRVFDLASKSLTVTTKRRRKRVMQNHLSRFNLSFSKNISNSSCDWPGNLYKE